MVHFQSMAAVRMFKKDRVIEEEEGVAPEGEGEGVSGDGVPPTAIREDEEAAEVEEEGEEEGESALDAAIAKVVREVKAAYTLGARESGEGVEARLVALKRELKRELRKDLKVRLQRNEAAMEERVRRMDDKIRELQVVMLHVKDDIADLAATKVEHPDVRLSDGSGDEGDKFEVDSKFEIATRRPPSTDDDVIVIEEDEVPVISTSAASTSQRMRRMPFLAARRPPKFREELEQQGVYLHKRGKPNRQTLIALPFPPPTDDATMNKKGKGTGGL